jgi:hypothetical protein
MGGRKTFVTNTVLTAADVQDFLMDQSVMVFANDASRGSAIPTPTEGMVSYQNDLDILQTYNGAAWVPAAGLNLITTQTFTSTNAINVDGVYSALYRNYQIFISLTSATGTSFALNYQHRQSGSTINTNYRNQRLFNYGSTITSDTIGGVTTSTAIFGALTAATIAAPFGHIFIANPFLSQPTTMLLNSTNGFDATQSIDQRTSSFHSGSTSMTGFRLFCDGANQVAGTFSVYGVK